MLRSLVGILLILAVGYAVLVAVMYLFQDRLLYFPFQEFVATPDTRGWAYEDVTLETEDGERLHGWWLPVEDERGTLLFFHGNAGNISGRLDSVEQFRRLGLSVFIFDYRGYGRSTGTPSEEGLYRDAAAAWRYLTETQERDPEAVVLFGRSLGAGPATWLAEQQPVGALIIESPFTSVPDVAAKHYPFVPVRLLARSSFDNLRRIREIEAPLLVIHSPADEIIPYEHGQRLYEAARSPKAFLELEGGHNDGFIVTGPRYRREIDAFLEQHLAPRR